jgi:hypothetical protein
MTFEITEFELAAIFLYLAACAGSVLVMALVLNIRHRRSPVGRLAPHRWFGV